MQADHTHWCLLSVHDWRKPSGSRCRQCFCGSEPKNLISGALEPLAKHNSIKRRLLLKSATVYNHSFSDQTTKTTLLTYRSSTATWCLHPSSCVHSSTSHVSILKGVDQYFWHIACISPPLLGIIALSSSSRQCHETYFYLRF